MGSECGHCGKVVLGDFNSINNHMQMKHGDDAEMGPDFLYWKKSFLARLCLQKWSEGP